MSTLPPAEPMPADALREVDRLLALVYIRSRLTQIPEFIRIWQPVIEDLVTALKNVQPEIGDRWEQLSPEGRGAVIAVGAPGFLLQPEEAQVEGASYVQEAGGLMRTQVGGQLDAYRAQMAKLLAPLTVPDLEDMFLIVDLKEYGVFDRLKDAHPIAGPLRDSLESAFLRALTDFGPADAAAMPPGKVQARVQRKLGSFVRHAKTYDLVQRVDLWFLNRVLGKSPLQIASEMQETGLVEAGMDPGDRVRKYIREMNVLLDTPHRRRAETGAFEAWKDLAK